MDHFVGQGDASGGHEDTREHAAAKQDHHDHAGDLQCPDQRLSQYAKRERPVNEGQQDRAQRANPRGFGRSRPAEHDRTEHGEYHR